MVSDGGDAKYLDISEVTGSMHAHQHLDCFWLLHIINFAIKGAMSSCENVAACYDRSSTKWFCRLQIIPCRYQANLKR